MSKATKPHTPHFGIRPSTVTTITAGGTYSLTNGNTDALNTGLSGVTINATGDNTITGAGNTGGIGSDSLTLHGSTVTGAQTAVDMLNSDTIAASAGIYAFNVIGNDNSIVGTFHYGSVLTCDGSNDTVLSYGGSPNAVFDFGGSFVAGSDSLTLESSYGTVSLNNASNFDLDMRNHVGDVITLQNYSTITVSDFSTVAGGSFEYAANEQIQSWSTTGSTTTVATGIPGQGTNCVFHFNEVIPASVGSAFFHAA